MYDYLKQILNSTKKLYLSTKEDSYSFYDITLSLITWRLLSDNRIITKNPIRSDNYNFQFVLNNLTDSCLLIDEALTYYEKNLQSNDNYEQPILKWDSSITEKIQENIWVQIMEKWNSFFNTSLFDNQDSIYEFWEHIERFFISDYRDEDTYLTPAALISVMTQYLKDANKKSAYDPYARTGNLLIETQHCIQDIQEINGISYSKLSWKLSTMRSLFISINSNIYLSNWDKTKTNNNKNQFDIIISNPPFGYQKKEDINLTIQNNYLNQIAHKSKRLEIIFLTHILDNLSKDGQATVLLPSIFLAGGTSVRDLIKYIIDKNILDLVIELPQGLFEHTAIAPVLFCFNKKRKTTQDIVLIDATDQVFKSGRQIQLKVDILTDWIKQIKSGEIIDSEQIVNITSNLIIAEEYNLYKLLHKQKINNEKSKKTTLELLKESEQLENKLVIIKKEIELLIQNNN